MFNQQSNFVTTFSPAHTGHQDFLHRDVHHHLTGPGGNLLNNPIGMDNHRPLIGQTTLNDFTLERRNGLW